MPLNTLSINFCGGCNPAIDRSAIATALKEYFSAHGWLVVYNKTNADAIVFLSGCRVSCAGRDQAVKTGCVHVAGDSVDCFRTDERDIVAAVLKQLGFREIPCG
ncbi:MAG: hypothetical protein LBS10_01650 [Gracilibacteraceae bacterium]|nr:hypothetical protein [Gracilibacteraceae bacterium]